MPLAVSKRRLMAATLLAVPLIWAPDSRAAIITVGAGGGYNFTTLVVKIQRLSPTHSVGF